MALADKKAAIVIHDRDVEQKIGQTIINLKNDKILRKEMPGNIVKMAKKDAALNIAKEIINLIKT